MFKKRNVDMFGDEQEYFENRQAEPMNEAFFEEHFDSSASVYGVNEDLSDRKKEARQLKKDKKSKFTAKNYLYPLTSVGFYTTLLIVELSVFIAFLSQEYTLSSTPLYRDSDMFFIVAAIAAVIVYVVFIFLSVPLLKFKENARSKVKELMGLDATPINVGNAQPANSSKNTDKKQFIRRNLGWIIPVSIVVIISSGGSAVIVILIAISLYRKYGKFYTDKKDNKKK